MAGSRREIRILHQGGVGGSPLWLEEEARACNSVVGSPDIVSRTICKYFGLGKTTFLNLELAPKGSVGWDCLRCIAHSPSPIAGASGCGGCGPTNIFFFLLTFPTVGSAACFHHIAIPRSVCRRHLNGVSSSLDRTMYRKARFQEPFSLQSQG